MFDYRAAPVRVVDGDSAVLLIDVGFGARVEEEIRLLDVSAPERYQTGGMESRDFVTAWLAQLPTRKWPLYVQTVPNTSMEPLERRTFTRYLATVWDFADRTRCLNEALAEFLAQHPEWGTGL